MRKCSVLLTALVLVSATVSSVAQEKAQAGQDFWTLAQKKTSIHRFATIFPANDVRRYFTSDDRLNEAVAWCKASGVTKVYLESFRGGYQADKDVLVRARDRFRKEGFVVCGGITTTNLGKKKPGNSGTACYTDPTTLDQLEQVFRFAASLFDVVMIDDFYFTDCQCEDCKKAKGDKSWSEFRMALMDQVSRDRVLKPSREVNPNVKIIIKYPEWYDQFHERGYDVDVESKLFDITWIGTETRDPDNSRWGKKPQFGAYWISLWTAAFSSGKFGGGWYDPYGTTANTYVEQGRQTILGLCPESMLFCYGGLQRDTGPDNVAKYRQEAAGQLDLAEFVKGEIPRGVGTYKPMSSRSGDDTYIFNFIGMLGVPMTADIKFPADASSLFLTSHALADKNLEKELGKTIEAGKPVLLTPALQKALKDKELQGLSKANVTVLPLDPAVTKKTTYWVLDSVRDLMNLSREKADALRRPLLEPLGVELSAPPRVSLYLYGKSKVVVENFNDEAVEVMLKVRDAKGFERAIVLPPSAEPKIETKGGEAKISLPARAMLALRIK